MIKVLIVDDEYTICTGLKDFFSWESIGFSVVGTAETALQALEWIGAHDVDVVLTDIIMPQMTGIQLAEIVRKKYPHIKIVFLSAYEEFEYAREALKYGVRGYVAKPTHIDALLDVFLMLKDEIDFERNPAGEEKASSKYKHGADAIDAVNQYLKKNFRTATLDEAAAFVHYNPFYLSYFFKRQTGETFSDCLLRIRMEEAAKLILNDRYKIYEISNMVGYSNAHNFSRTFKSYYKTTPLNYKKKGDIQSCQAYD